MTDNNPKTAAGRAKASLWLTSSTIALGDAAVSDLGGINYGVNNFIKEPVSCSVYLSATKRHIDDFAAGFDMDEDEPDIHNLLFARKNLEIIIEAQLHGTLIDDRVKQPWYREWRRKLVEAKKRWLERKRLRDLADKAPYSEALDAA